MFNKKKIFLSLIIFLVFAGLVSFVVFKYGVFLFSGMAELSWNKNQETDLAGYRIYYGSSPRMADCPDGGYEKNIDVGKTDTPENPAFKIYGLEIGKTYYFSITGYNTVGKESCFSVEASKAVDFSFKSLVMNFLKIK